MIHPDLYPYQRYGANWLASKETALLADGMGVGKSAQAIAAADQVTAKSVLVLTPGIARENWAREWFKWSMYKRRVGIVESTAKGVPNADVVVASYSILSRRPILQALLAKEYDLLICDESHYLKNKDAIRTKAVFGAKCDRTKGLSSRSKRVWLLSGTPFPNNLSEAWPSARALFPNAVMGVERYSSWRDRFCVMDNTGVRVVNSKNLTDFVERMKPYTLRRRVEDVLPDLPPIRFAHVVVSPDKLPAKSQEEKDAEAVVKAAIAQRLQLEGRHGELTEDDIKAIQYQMGMHLGSVRKWTGIAKAHAVAQLINEDFQSGMDKVVVFACHRQVFDVLLKEIPGSKAIHGGTPMKERDHLIDVFQGKIAGEKLDTLIVHLDIASTAITLTAASHVVFAEMSWTPSHMQQAAKRCHRIGQTRPVLARFISLRDSIDEAVANVVSRKTSSLNKLEGALTVAPMGD